MLKKSELTEESKLKENAVLLGMARILRLLLESLMSPELTYKQVSKPILCGNYPRENYHSRPLSART